MKVIDVKLTPIVSPVCQTLLYESASLASASEVELLFDRYKELLVIRLDGTVIGYSTFDLENDTDMLMNNLYFRSFIKDHALAEYWLSRLLKQRLRDNTYLNFLLDS